MSKQSIVILFILFILHAEYMIRNVTLDEAQAGRNINNLRYAGDTTLMAETEEELKNLLMSVKAENKISV